MRYALPLLLPLVLLGCDANGPAPVACTLEARPGIVVAVTDAVTNASPTSTVRLTISSTDGSFVEVTERAPDPTRDTLLLGGIFERLGTYGLRLDASSYHPWTRAGVAVGMTPDGCHVATVELDARLAPLAP